MSWMKRMLYPILGVVVLGSYTHVVRRGIEPFEVSSEERKLPAGASAHTNRSNTRRYHSVFWISGFGGK